VTSHMLQDCWSLIASICLSSFSGTVASARISWWKRVYSNELSTRSLPLRSQFKPP
jgi:TRAP-type C4-dicarboxylate transport system permease small subunit